MRRIYYLIADLGDGSATVRFFDNKEQAESLCDDEYDTYGQNEGGPSWFEITGEISGVKVRSPH